MSSFAAKNPLIVILGPTSSGKSDLAVEIAKKFNGEIISADSRQVYRGMNIGTGKVPLTKNPPPLPSPFLKKGGGRRPFGSLGAESSGRTPESLRLDEEEVKISDYHKGIPHHLLDVASPKQRFTVAQYKKLALAAIKKIHLSGKLPILCGGTGLYIQAVVDDLPIPAVKPNLILRAQLEKKSTTELFAILQKLDPVRAANIDSKNPRRLIRAIEIVKTTGKPVPPIVIARSPERRRGTTRQSCALTATAAKNSRPSFTPLFLGIKKSPAELKKLIHKRLLNRFKQGMIKEVADLHSSGISWKRLDSFGLEYRWIALFLQKKIDRKTMLARLQKESEHYAKRQMTWFKRDQRIHWVTNKKQALRLVKKFLKK